MWAPERNWGRSLRMVVSQWVAEAVGAEKIELYLYDVLAKVLKTQGRP